MDQEKLARQAIAKSEAASDARAAAARPRTEPDDDEQGSLFDFA